LGSTILLQLANTATDIKPTLLKIMTMLNAENIHSSDALKRLYKMKYKSKVKLDKVNKIDNQDNI
jgi:hypothetical protein